jgi:hypothetical protein
VLRFKETELGRYFQTSNTGMQIPVRRTIEGSGALELAYGAQFRLIVFPSRMTLNGAWRHYDVSWEIFDTKTGKRVWSTVSNGKHTNAWRDDEDPQQRAKTVVDGLVAALKSSGLI